MCTPNSRPLLAAAFSAAILAAGLMDVAIQTSCTPAGGQVVVNDTTIALKDVLCLLQTFSAEVQGAISPTQAVIDAASKCGVARAVATSILASHVAAAEREGSKVKLPTDAGSP